MQARYYDPVIGRFYSNDPVGYTSENPVMSFNRYLYVNNNPYKYTDPNGEFLNFAIGAIVGAIAETANQALAGKGFDGSKIAASAAIGGVTSGLSAIKMIATAGKAGKMVMEGGLNAVGAAGESMIHDGLDGNNADLGKALTSAATLVPGIGNVSTVSKIVSNEVGGAIERKAGQYVSDEAAEYAGKLVGGATGAATGSGIKAVENYAREEDKK